MANEESIKNLKPKATDYAPTFHDEAGYQFALLGKTLKEMAFLFGVSHQTLKNWLKLHPSFFASVTRGRDIADAKVAEGLYKRATGFTVPERHYFVVSTGDFKQKVETIDGEKYYPPDPGAAMNWLKNRQPDTWRDKIDLGLPPEIVLTMKMDDGDGPKEEQE